VRILAVLCILCVALAGCSRGGPEAPEETEGPLLEGWVVDERIVPVSGALVRLAGAGLETRTGEDGHYALGVPRGIDLVVVIEAPGFKAASGALAAQSGSHHFLNFSLERIPVAEPFDEVQQFNGILRCGIVATTQEDPSRPHEHQGVRCSQTINDTSNRWSYHLPPDLTGVVVEVAWDPQSDVAQALVLKITVEATGEVVCFIEGTSILRLQLSSVKLAQEMQAGHTVLSMTLEPGAGTGNHEHGAVGAFAQQAFVIYATAFFNGPVPPSYSIQDRA
jgi:hypothetical protein